jgi:hypothetical protein
LSQFLKTGELWIFQQCNLTRQHFLSFIFAGGFLFNVLSFPSVFH